MRGNKSRGEIWQCGDGWLFIIEENIFGEPTTDEEIVDFLTLAGLKDAVPTSRKPPPLCRRGRADRQAVDKLVYCQIISEAVALLEAEVGAKDDLGLGIGMEREDIYKHMFSSSL